MPADTMNDMILGFSVILVVLIIYAMTLILRIRQAKRKQRTFQDK